MNEVLPPDYGAGDGHQDKSGGLGTININNAHIHGNDLRELGKIAETNPTFAKEILDYQDRVSGRENNSYRLGIVAAVILLLAALGTIALIVLEAGLIESLLASGLLLASAVLIRVILVGKWSETSWFGRLVNVLVRVLGGKSDDERDADGGPA